MPEKTKILLVEDENFISSLLKTRLEREGFEVTQAFDGEEALTKMRESKPDFVILDLILPKLSGFEVMEAISVDPELSRVPVVILSNLAQESDIQKIKSLGAREYFVKVRVSTDEIIERIKSLLAAK